MAKSKSKFNPTTNTWEKAETWKVGADAAAKAAKVVKPFPPREYAPEYAQEYPRAYNTVEEYNRVAEFTASPGLYGRSTPTPRAGLRWDQFEPMKPTNYPYPPPPAMTKYRVEDVVPGREWVNPVFHGNAVFVTLGLATFMSSTFGLNGALLVEYLPREHLGDYSKPRLVMPLNEFLDGRFTPGEVPR